MQFPKINWLYFQLGKVKDRHFLTCKCCHHQSKHQWGNGEKKRNQFCGARSKMFTCYSWTLDLGNTLAGWYQIPIVSFGNLSWRGKLLQIKLKEAKKALHHQQQETEQDTEVLLDIGEGQSFVPACVWQLVVRSPGLERYITNKYNIN